MTNLVCTLCHETIDRCQCPGTDERLHKAAYDPEGQVLFKWCRKCDKHFARCQCPTPEFYVIAAGQPVNPATLRNALGHRVEIDLTRK